MIMKCEHCKLDYKQAQMIEYKGKFFCCKGCESVWEILHESGLDEFYEKLGNQTLSPVNFQNEMKNYKEEFRSKLPKIYSKELLESLFYEVYTKISYIEKACNVTRITATSYLNQLEEIGLLESEKVGRERLYKNVRLIKLLSEN